MGEGCYSRYNSFGLAPRRPHYADRRIGVGNRILYQQRRYGLAFAALSTPSRSCELVIFKDISELFLIDIGFETQDLLKKINGINT